MKNQHRPQRTHSRQFHTHTHARTMIKFSLRSNVSCCLCSLFVQLLLNTMTMTTMTATVMASSVVVDPTTGYHIREDDNSHNIFNMDGQFWETISTDVIEEFKQGEGLKSDYDVVLQVVSNDNTLTFPDGTVVTQEEAVEAERPGRKVVICGDTCDSRALVKLAQGADLVVHEATNAYLEGIDSNTDWRSVERDAIIHGHSTPTIAARFARAVQAKRLVLNHFSARYKGDASVESISIMQRIEDQAIRQVPGWNETNVAAAWDLMVLPIPHRS